MSWVRFVLVHVAVAGCVLAQEVEEAGLVPLSEQLQDAYASATASPQEFLIDPFGLLRKGDAKDRREFLRYHSSDSLIDLYVILFKKDQLVFNADDLSGQLLVERANAKPAVLVHYFMGRPERTKLYLSAELKQVVPETELEQSLESAVARAKAGVTPLDELENFILQASIRIYRMERLLTDGSASPAPLTARTPEEQDIDAKEKAAFLEPLKSFWNAYRLKLFAGLVVLALLWIAKRWHRRRASYRFPDHDVEVRLGGAHAAGVGAVIHFSKSSPPPAAQRERL